MRDTLLLEIKKLHVLLEMAKGETMEALYDKEFVTPVGAIKVMERAWEQAEEKSLRARLQQLEEKKRMAAPEAGEVDADQDENAEVKTGSITLCAKCNSKRTDDNDAAEGTSVHDGTARGTIKSTANDKSKGKINTAGGSEGGAPVGGAPMSKDLRNGMC